MQVARVLFVVCLSAAFLWMNAGAWAAERDIPPNRLGVEAAVEQAFAANPGLREVQTRYDALAALPSQVGTRPDPMLSLNAQNFPTDTFAYDQEPMTQVQLGISQQLPFPGKLALRAEAAEYDAVAARHNVAEARLLLERDVRSLWWGLYYLDRSLDIVARNQELLRQFVRIAQTKYQVGDGLQQDVLLAQLELSKLLDQEIMLNGTRRMEAAKLNRLMNQPGDVRLELPETVGLTLPDVATETDLYHRAEANRPSLARQQSRIQAAQSRVALAKKDYYPDFTVGAAYGFRWGENPGMGERSDLMSLGVSVNLPIYQNRKRAQAVSQRESELSGARYALADELDQLRSEITQGRALFSQARDQLELLETGIIPQARQTVESMLAGYQVSEVDFLNLVRSQVTLYNYETLYWRSLATANQTLARIRAAVGGEIGVE